MNWDFLIGYWVGALVAAAICFAVLGDHDDHDGGDDYHYDFFDSDHIQSA